MSNILSGNLPTTYTIRPLEHSDIDAIAKMEMAVWHDYYRQYPFYDLVCDSVTPENIAQSWASFLDSQRPYSGGMVTGDDRCAFAAWQDAAPIGVAAASAYRPDTWPEVDQLLTDRFGALPKLAKFQNLYVAPAARGQRIGTHLALVRARTMLERGYTGLFLTTFADAHRTNAYHQKQGLERVHTYLSLQRYKGGARVPIACFLHTDLHALHDRWQKRLTSQADA